MNRCCLLFLVFFTLAGFARAIDAPSVPPEPDHLVPLDPYPGDWHIRYTEAVAKYLQLDRSYDLQMLARPSFSPEYVVRLRPEEGATATGTPPEKFELVYTIADKNIWYAMPENNDEKKQRNVTASTTVVGFPKDLAGRVQQLWTKMLRRVRYPEEPSRGLDGETYEFTTFGMYGETWSPQERKSPALFVELGESLIAYAKAKPEERPAAEKAIETKAAELEKYLAERPRK